MYWIPQILPFPWFSFLLFTVVMMWGFVCMYSNFFMLEEKSMNFPSNIDNNISQNWL